MLTGMPVQLPQQVSSFTSWHSGTGMNRYQHSYHSGWERCWGRCPTGMGPTVENLTALPSLHRSGAQSRPIKHCMTATLQTKGKKSSNLPWHYKCAQTKDKQTTLHSTQSSPCLPLPFLTGLAIFCNCDYEAHRHAPQGRLLGGGGEHCNKRRTRGPRAATQLAKPLAQSAGEIFPQNVFNFLFLFKKREQKKAPNPRSF